jgi:ankyrin repeat protein
MKKSGIKKLSIVLATMLTVCVMHGSNQPKQKSDQNINTKTGVFDFKVSPEELIAAAHEGDIALIKSLLEKGADVNTADKDGNTALMQASNNGHTKTAKLLIEKGAEVNAIDKNGWTALMVASYNSHTETAKLLLEKARR